MPLAWSGHDIIVHSKRGQAASLGFGWLSSNIDTFASGIDSKFIVRVSWFVFCCRVDVASCVHFES